VQTSVYAVEDKPPTNWPVSNISHGGVWDAATGKVKFGPFYDAEPRTLSYEVLSPVWGLYCALGVFCFSGQASADGVNSPIVGQQCRVLAANFPADVNLPHRRLSIEEVTAYAAAWRRGLNWRCHAQGIPIDYVTRAAFLWRAGECYTVDSLITNEPLWWVTCATNVSLALTPVSSLTFAGSAERQLPPAFVPGESLPVVIAVTPIRGTTAYAVEDQFPAGWTVAQIGQGGELDSVHGQVRWGPFFDDTLRTLAYQAIPPSTASGAASFVGAASFDGTGASITGSRQVCARCCLAVGPQPHRDQFTLTLGGELGRRYGIEASTDLMEWTPLAELTNSTGHVEFSDALPAGSSQRFYRARLIE
jgi:hypothetical protein